METLANSLADEIVGALGSNGFSVDGCMISSNGCVGEYSCSNDYCHTWACLDDYTCAGDVNCSIFDCTQEYANPPC